MLACEKNSSESMNRNPKIIGRDTVTKVVANPKKKDGSARGFEEVGSVAIGGGPSGIYLEDCAEE